MIFPLAPLALACSLAHAADGPREWSADRGGNGHRYQVVCASDGPIGWFEARMLAVDMGGDLVSIDTPAENDFVYELVVADPAAWMRRPGGDTHGPWIGAHVGPSGEWQWADGSPLHFTRWAAAEPLRSGGRYAHFVGRESPSARWASAAPTSPHIVSFVVEWPAGEGDDAEKGAAHDLVPSTEAPAPPQAAPKPAQRHDAATTTPYIVVPMSGELGEDLLAAGVADALRRARHARIEHIVFDLDCEAGHPEEARALFDLLLDEQDNFTYHAVVRRAMGPSLWLLANCGTVWAVPDARIAGPVLSFAPGLPAPPPAGLGSGDISSIAANLAVAAERSGGLPAEVVRAMVVPEVQLYAIAAVAGPRFVNERVEGAQVLDDHTRTLALTAQELVRWGLAGDLASGDPDDLGDFLGVRSWKHVSGIGELAMRQTARRADQLRSRRDRYLEQVDAAIRTIPTATARVSDLKRQAIAAEPGERLLLSRDYRTGQLTRSSRRRWQEATDRAVDLWEDVKLALHELDRTEKLIATTWRRAVHADQQHAELRKGDAMPTHNPPVVTHNVDKDAVYREADRNQARLRRNRNRT